MRYGKPRQSGLRYNFEKVVPLARFRGHMRLTYPNGFRYRCYGRLSTINKNYRTKVSVFPFLCIACRK